MANPSQLRNLGHSVNIVPAVTFATQINAGTLSAGAGLIITTTGITIDTMFNPNATGAQTAVALYRRPFSCIVTIPFLYGLASGQSWAVGGLLRHCSASGGTYATLATLNTTTVSKAGATTTSAFPVYTRSQTAVDLQNLGAKRFLKVRTTVTGNSTVTGSLISRGTVVIAFNADQTPATATGARG
jgi:hypothetical protein